MTDISFRGPVMLGITALFLLVAGVGTWATQATLAGAIVVPGQVEVADNRRTVQHPDGGLVAEVFVREGSVVAAGDPLVQLDGTELASRLRINEGQLSELIARAARLVAERDGADAPAFPAARSPGNASQIDGQLRLFTARRATLANASDLMSRRIDQIHALQDGITAQRTALETRLMLVKDDLSSQQLLFDKGLVAQGPVLASGVRRRDYWARSANLPPTSPEAMIRLPRSESRSAALPANGKRTPPPNCARSRQAYLN